ncbi:helix-turn-helix domain-containing protein [Ancylobacter sp. TS-1]|uniref:helix-turn-helix domain-containing protein n=1 Tax=Ancylobacter sp. TS-1 TaxID=1850374 RepID=UPI001265CDF9|nr:helix-turn-helix domain-containing protein [Ancylobacter sp. TS-1]QFR34709.1 DNA-binding protein [Ancylobacter sp. TS-1]
MNSGAHQPAQHGEYLSETQAAAYANVSVAKLRKDRVMKRGFKYCRLGRRIIYRREDIDGEMAGNLVHPLSA